MNVRALAISCLLAGALYYTYGQFSLDWITVLPIVFALAVFSVPVPTFFSRHERALSLIVCLLFLAVSAVSLLPDEKFLRSMIVDVADASYLPTMRILFGVTAAFICGLFVVARLERKRLAWICFTGALASMVAAFALIMPTSPRAQIDVWTVHEEGAAAFIAGHNPYLAEYTNIYPEELRAVLTPGGVTYSYLPGTFMWMAPWKAADLDTRYSQLLTRLLTSVFLVLIAWRARGRLDFLTFVPSLLFITFPLNTFFIVRAWNDDISLMFYTLAAWALLSRRSWAFFIACNCLLILKHHAIFFAPMLLWFAWKTYGGVWWRLILASTWFAALVHAGYLIADWRNYLGSLYGLTFLKYPNVHHVFPDRRDPFSLMNYLYLYTGFKTSLAFVVVMALVAYAVVRKSARAIDLPASLRGLAAMAFAMFIFGPVAFANYYEFALGLTLIAAAASAGAVSGAVTAKTWEIQADGWTLSYIASRAAILFIFSELIVETRYFHSVADLIFADRLPYFDFGFNFLPFALIPSVVPKAIQSLGGLQAFIGYHTEFQLIVLCFDLLVATLVFRRFRRGESSKTAMAFFIVGPVLVAPLYLTSATLVTIAFVWVISRLVMHTALYVNARATVLARRRFYFVFFLSALLLAAFAVWALAVYSDIELQINPLLSPTALLVWMVALAPLLICRQAWPRDRGLGRLAGAMFVACLLLTFYLLLSIEAVVENRPGFASMVLARNGLLILTTLVFALHFYRSRVVRHDV